MEKDNETVSYEGLCVLMLLVKASWAQSASGSLAQPSESYSRTGIVLTILTDSHKYNAWKYSLVWNTQMWQLKRKWRGQRDGLLHEKVKAFPGHCYNVAQVWRSRLIMWKHSSIVNQSQTEPAWLAIRGEECWQHAFSWLTVAGKENRVFSSCLYSCSSIPYNIPENSW